MTQASPAVAALTVAALLAPCINAQEPLVPATELRALDSLAKRLAKSCMDDEVYTILGVLERVGYAPRTLEILRKGCEKDLVKSKPAKLKHDVVLKLCDEAVAKMLAVCDAASGDAQKAIAREILVLDRRIDRAHELVGHAKAHNRWIAPSIKPLLDREVAVLGAIADALALKLEPSRVTTSDVIFIEKLLDGQPGTLADGFGITLHTTLSREATRQVLVDYARASAFANFLLTGETKPIRIRPVQFLLVDSRERFHKLLEILQQDGRMPADEAAFQKRGSFFWDPRNEYLVMHARDSRAFSAYLLAESLDRLPYRTQPVFRTGLANYVCLATLGCPIPKYVPPGAAHDASAGSPAPKLLRAQAGLIGLEAYLTDALHRGRAVPWSKSFVNDIGEIRDDNLLKSTGMMQFLCAYGPIEKPLKECPEDGASDPTSRAQLIEKGFGRSVDEIETLWSEWIRQASPSIAERLLARKSVALDRERSAMLKQLNKARSAATISEEKPSKVALNGLLSAGASDHVRYLTQLAKKPMNYAEGHLQDPSEPGFSVSGLRTGPQSLVAFDVADASAALDHWFASFYGRLSLLHPGILDLGFAREGKTCALDCRSLVARPKGEYMVQWPHDGMKKVPTHYAHDLRNPVAGAKERNWGYPVTLQLFRGDQTEAGEVSIELFFGNPSKKKVVDCHVSTPDRPSNPAFIPPNTYGLIPKAPLKPRSEYTVVVTFKQTNRRVLWKFKT